MKKSILLTFLIFVLSGCGSSLSFDSIESYEDNYTYHNEQMKKTVDELDVSDSASLEDKIAVFEEVTTDLSDILVSFSEKQAELASTGEFTQNDYVEWSEKMSEDFAAYGEEAYELINNEE